MVSPNQRDNKIWSLGLLLYLCRDNIKFSNFKLRNYGTIPDSFLVQHKHICIYKIKKLDLLICLCIFMCNFLVPQMVKNLPAMQKTWIQSLGQEAPLEKGTAIHSSILAWIIPWTGQPGGLQSMGLQRVGHDWETDTFLHFNVQFIDLVLFLDKQLKWFFNSRILTEYPGLCVSLSPSVNHR